MNRVRSVWKWALLAFFSAGWGWNPSSFALENGPPEPPVSVIVLDAKVHCLETVSIVVTGESPLSGLALWSNGAPLRRIQRFTYDGPPFAQLFQAVAPANPGTWQIDLVKPRGERQGTTRVAVVDAEGKDAPMLGGSVATGIWRIEREWDEAFERLFSFWIAYLFRPLEGQPNRGWKTLHDVLRNGTRNFLFNRLGHDEDDPKAGNPIRAVADCGDLPYHLRAYFAWKFGLPFRFRDCSRGTPKKGPTCRVSIDNRDQQFNHIENPVQRFNAFLNQRIAWQVHSGTMRTLPEDAESDFYPISLSRKAIRPGTVFVDIGGHALMVTEWSENGLWAVDGHPDKTVTRKAFCAKYFRPFVGTRTGGFKAFRPIEMHGEEMVPVTRESELPAFSVEQYRFSNKNDFYDRVQGLIQLR